MANLEKFAFNFKSLLDAIRLRNHVIEMFERADLESDLRVDRRSLPLSLPEVALQVWNLLAL